MTNWYVQETLAFTDHTERIQQAERRRRLRTAATRRPWAAWWNALRARWHRRRDRRRALDRAVPR